MDSRGQKNSFKTIFRSDATKTLFYYFGGPSVGPSPSSRVMSLSNVGANNSSVGQLNICTEHLSNLYIHICICIYKYIYLYICIYINICICVTANLRNQIFPGISNPLRESEESLKHIVIPG